MNRDRLIRMANQIGGFFEAMPDRRQAVADIATHLQKTWEPRMRAEILKALGSAEEAQLTPMVREALAMLANAA